MNYALAVTTCAGLWRYLVGDTVTVVERDPPRVLVTGRTSYMLSAFGEHVIGAEVERAVAEAARAIGATVSDFAAGSLFPEETGARGGHLYIVELGPECGANGLDAARHARFAEDSTRRSAASTTIMPPTARAVTAWMPRACAFSPQAASQRG